MSLTSQIKQLAAELGFDQVGITRPESLEEGERAICDWVAEGKHGDMKYLEEFTARRERFFKDFPGAKSVIVLGVNYYTKSMSSPNDSIGDPGGDSRFRGNGKALQGKVARYAWGKDYHEVIRKKHAVFLEKLKILAGGDFRAISCVDTQPIPERYAAMKAGLGFLGKHTGVLSQEFGPWLFLSEIITDLELEEDLPASGDCGSCDHCQKICPTGALNEDYSIDARLCIAYLTIEHKGVIPHELRPQIKDWIFGCDECLAVCPFTSKSRESGWSELGPSEGVGERLAMDAVFEIGSNREYEHYFSKTALLRTNRKQMLRNACIVLGNSGLPEALPYIKKALADASGLVRLHAAWALGRLKIPTAKVILQEFRRLESDPLVLQEMDLTLKELEAVS